MSASQLYECSHEWQFFRSTLPLVNQKLRYTLCRFVDHQCHDLRRDDDVLMGTDVDKALNEETAGSKRLWGIYLCGCWLQGDFSLNLPRLTAVSHNLMIFLHKYSHFC